MWVRKNFSGVVLTAATDRGDVRAWVTALSRARGPWVITVSGGVREGRGERRLVLEDVFPPITAENLEEAAALMELRLLEIERLGLDAMAMMGRL